MCIRNPDLDCANCGTFPVSRPRHLCWRCYAVPSVRDRFQADPTEPTRLKPGNPAKIDVLARRVERQTDGRSLHLPGDVSRPINYGPFLAFVRDVYVPDTETLLQLAVSTAREIGGPRLTTEEAEKVARRVHKKVFGKLTCGKTILRIEERIVVATTRACYKAIHEKFVYTIPPLLYMTMFDQLTEAVFEVVTAFAALDREEVRVLLSHRPFAEIEAEFERLAAAGVFQQLQAA